MSARLGIDVGGTFTDLLLLDDSMDGGRLRLLKTPSTPDDQSRGIVLGIEKLLEQTRIPANEIRSVLHGTTVSTNIVLEQKGAKVGLLVTENHEQVLHLARSQTPGPLAGWMIMQKPDPLADLEHTRGIVERIDSRGEVVTPLDETQARAAIAELLDAGVESITVSLLHAYANPAHERRLRALIGEAAGDLPTSISSEILPEFREYERALVTVMNAYVRPAMRHYLSNLQEKLRSVQFTPSVNIVRSDGGLMSLERAADTPVHTMLSGPAGGVAGAAYVATLSRHQDALTLDMGGTSTDVALIRDGEPTVSRQTSLGYYPVKVPSVEVHSVGAGGGSIAHVPMTGALRVGPESAGAQPGPACYGKGGRAPTVTDANVVLGRLPPTLLGGEMALDVAAAEVALGTVARALGLDLHQAAQGILDIVNENMFGALRLVSVQKGLDPRDFALVAFGGAGPLHGNAMGILAGCFPVIVPPTPGVLSALGFLCSDVKNEFAQTFIRSLDEADPHAMQPILAALGEQARRWMDDEGVPAADQRLSYQADVRYLRQGYEFAMDIEPEGLANGAIKNLQDRFGALHDRLYGFKLDAPVEIVNLRAVGRGRVTKVDLPRAERGDPDPGPAELEQRQVYFDGQFMNARVFDRSRLRAGNLVTGPAVIQQTDTTTLIHPGHAGSVDEYLNVLIAPSATTSQ
ncbi:MAG: hydantoinase/oxoprolinase family protein [Gammaproteobacteria bacterium]